MEINRKTWEEVAQKTKAMMQDAELTMINARLMNTKAHEELKKCPVIKKTVK